MSETPRPENPDLVDKKKEVRAVDTREYKNWKETVRTQIDEKCDLVVLAKPKSELDVCAVLIVEHGSDEAVLDFSRIMEPMFDRNKPMPKSFWGGHEIPRTNFKDVREWASIEDNSVSLSGPDLKDPRKTFFVLHEMGHTLARNLYNDEYEAERDLDKKSRILNIEQRAWQAAFMLAETIKEDSGVDLFSLFDDRAALDDWIKNMGLHSYEKDVDADNGKES